MYRRHSIDVAIQVVRLLQFTPYMAQVVMNDKGILVKAADTEKKAAVITNVDKHRSKNNNWLQDKIAVVKITTNIIRSLRAIQ